MAPKTSDGYVWTADAGVSRGGLECVGVIQPPQSPQILLSSKYDVIVIGAGYAGLVAARDLTTTGHSVLLLEARDRIGGRTYTVSKDGFKYEMGGTWVTHHMQYLFREMTRYGMDRDLILTGDPDKAKGYYTINVPGATPRKLPHDEAGRMTARAWDIFVNVDGAQCRNVCPLPHAQLGNVVVDRATVERWDRLSCRDRFDEIRHHLSAEEAGLLESLLLHISGGHMETSSLWDMIRSHALLAYSWDNFNDIWLRYKLREGQSELAKRMFDEAVDTGLRYAFSSPVDAIEETPQKSPEGVVRVLTKDGKTYKAARVICTVPLHVLGDVKFTPLLSAKRREAIQLGHVNHMTKIHADVKNPELARWNGMRYPNALMYGYGDGNIPNGNVHIVAFGKDERDTFVPERDPEKVVDALKKLHHMDVERLLFHNWSTDPYSKGGPAWWRPGYMTKYQDELQSRHGNVFFASADWAHGWRAAIDGALEQGTIAAHQCNTELRKLRKLISTSKL